ncbi:VOC family protein [Geobacter sp.]|uniref:VOC family protein n=1 Tax=Geobacter sp. TaxID=46610 RepID=UPI0027B899ED|nr:VOC family protein [Geobacter sp.]
MVEAMKNVVVFVRDFEAAKRFYKEQLKLPLAQEGVTMMEFFSGGTTLGVALTLTDEAKALAGRHTGITLRVKDIENFCRELTDAGVRFEQPLEQSPWGKMAVVADPDGNLFALADR